MTTSPRRRFLKNASLFPLVAGFPFANAHADISPIDRIGGSHLRVSLNAFSFLELLNANAKDPKKGLDLFGVCDFCAKHNFDAVDLTGYFFPGYPNAPEDRYLISLKRHAFDLGLEISGTGVRNDFTALDKEVRKEGVLRIKTWIEVAAKLGAPVIRAFADSQPPFKDWHHASGNADRDAVEQWVADSLRECSEYPSISVDVKLVIAGNDSGILHVTDHLEGMADFEYEPYDPNWPENSEHYHSWFDGEKDVMLRCGMGIQYGRIDHRKDGSVGWMLEDRESNRIAVNRMILGK